MSGMTNNPFSNLLLFQNLPEETIQEICRYSILHDYAENAVLILEGQPVEHFFILLSGTVEIVKALDSDSEHHLALRYAGDTLGEMNLFAQKQIHSASARALGVVRAAQIAMEDMETLISKNPQIARRLFQIISLRMRNSEGQLIQDLRQRNQSLQQALDELKAAQAQLVAQEKLEHELAMAHDIQRSLLPKEIPSLPGWQVNAVWEPARAVSGDFYDFFFFPDGRFGLIVGDVTGKGVPAALVMATTRSVLHAVTSTVSHTQIISPGEILAQVNNILCPDMPRFMFVTCLLAIIDLQTGSLVVANAGHVLPTRITVQDAQELRVVGFPLGMMPDQAYESVSSQLFPGESIFCLSDGLVEAHNPQGEMYGSPRLKQQLDTVRQQLPLDGQALIGQLMEELHAFTGDSWEQEDDLTFVTLTRL